MQPKKNKESDLGQVTTRIQLQGYGASRYHAGRLTKEIEPVGCQGRSFAYAIADVITSIRDYLQNPRIKQETRQTLELVLQSLLGRLSNVVEVPFVKGHDAELSKLAKHLQKIMSRTDAALANLKATAATVRGKHKK